MTYHFEKYLPAFMHHLARHFPGSGVPGSVFTATDLNTPRKVIHYAYEKIKDQYEGRKLVTPIDCGRIIGLEALIALREVPRGIRIKRVSRITKGQDASRKSSYTVNVVKGLAMPPTTLMTIVAEPIAGRENAHAFTSIFPGRFAPDFSDSAFWARHALIET